MHYGGTPPFMEVLDDSSKSAEARKSVEYAVINPVCIVDQVDESSNFIEKLGLQKYTWIKPIHIANSVFKQKKSQTMRFLDHICYFRILFYYSFLIGIEEKVEEHFTKVNFSAVPLFKFAR